MTRPGRTCNIESWRVPRGHTAEGGFIPWATAELDGWRTEGRRARAEGVRSLSKTERPTGSTSREPGSIASCLHRIRRLKRFWDGPDRCAISRATVRKSTAAPSACGWTASEGGRTSITTQRCTTCPSRHKQPPTTCRAATADCDRPDTPRMWITGTSTKPRLPVTEANSPRGPPSGRRGESTVASTERTCGR